jgi:tripartite-type tricarboxylate transporter receptor subunit TctC
VNDFAPITMVASTAILMALHPSVPADTVRGLIEAAKTRPQMIANYGSAGTGTVFHLTGELFKQLAGLQLQHVPYRGGAPTVSALLAGEIPLAFETMLVLQPHVRAGTLRALAVTSLRRSAIMPDIPTTAEAGFPGLVADNSYALFAPSGTRAHLVAMMQGPLRLLRHYRQHSTNTMVCSRRTDLAAMAVAVGRGSRLRWRRFTAPPCATLCQPPGSSVVT